MPSLPQSNHTKEETEEIRIASAIIIELLSCSGLTCNVLILITFFVHRYWKQGSIMILFVNILFCDMFQLFLAAVDIAPELIRDVWQDFIEISFSNFGLLIWYCRLLTFVLTSTHSYITVFQSDLLQKWFSMRRIIVMLTVVWSISFIVSLTPLIGFGCGDIFQLRYEIGDSEACDRYKKFKYNPLQICTHIVNSAVVVWMIYCYVAILKQLKKIRPKCKSTSKALFIKIRNFNAEAHYRKIRSICWQFITVSSVFACLCILLLIGELSNYNVVLVICQRIAYTLNSVLPSIIIIKTKRSTRQDICCVLKLLMGKKILAKSSKRAVIEVATIV